MYTLCTFTRHLPLLPSLPFHHISLHIFVLSSHRYPFSHTNLPLFFLLKRRKHIGWSVLISPFPSPHPLLITAGCCLLFSALPSSFSSRLYSHCRTNYPFGVTCFLPNQSRSIPLTAQVAIWWRKWQRFSLRGSICGPAASLHGPLPSTVPASGVRSMVHAQHAPAWSPFPSQVGGVVVAAGGSRCVCWGEIGPLRVCACAMRHSQSPTHQWGNLYSQCWASTFPFSSATTVRARDGMHERNEARVHLISLRLLSALF